MKQENKGNIIIGTVSSLEVISIYTGGINLSRTFINYNKPIFIGTVLISLISPYLLNEINTYIFKKIKHKSKNK